MSRLKESIDYQELALIHQEEAKLYLPVHCLKIVSRPVVQGLEYTVLSWMT